MIVNVRLFAHARDLAGRDAIAVDLPDQATVSTLRAAIGREQSPTPRPGQDQGPRRPVNHSLNHRGMLRRVTTEP